MNSKSRSASKRFLLLGSVALLIVVMWSTVRPLARNAAPNARGSGAPCRIASVILAGDEILLDLVPRRCLIAVSRYAGNALYSNVAGKVKGIRAIGPSVERIVHLRPDLVIVASYSSPAAKRLLRAVGIPIFEFRQFTSMSGIETSIRELGRAVGAVDRAEALVAGMEHRLRSLRRRARDLPRLRILYFAFGGFVHGLGTSIDAVIKASGGVNAAAAMGITDAREISSEVLLGMNPDLIVVGSVASDAKVLARARRTPALRHLGAVRRGAIYAMPHALTGTVSQYSIDAVETMQAIMRRHARRYQSAEAPARTP